MTRPLSPAWSLALVLLVAASVSTAAHAQTSTADALAPSLETQTDDIAHAYVAYGSSADAVGLAFGEYALRVHLAANRFFGVELSPGWRRHSDEAQGPRLGVAAEVWPMGRGLHGVVLGVEVLSAWLPGDPSDTFELGLIGRAGYRMVWRGVIVGGSLGFERRFRFGGQNDRSYLPVVRIELGFGWG